MAFIDSALVALRESLEAFLILGILLGIAQKTGQISARKPLLWGAFAGLLASILLGVLANGVAHELYEANEALFEGVASLFAVAILTYMVIWMYRHTQGLVGALHTQMKKALSLGKPALLWGIAFVAVLREGVETVLFVAGKLPSDGVPLTVFALLTGIAVSAILAYLIFAGVLKLSLERFMAATGLMLVVIAAGLFAYGVHELREAGVFADTTGLLYDISATLPHKGDADGVNTLGEAIGSLLYGLVVYRSKATVLEGLSWFAYAVPMGLWVASKLRSKRAVPSA